MRPSSSRGVLACQKNKKATSVSFSTLPAPSFSPQGYRPAPTARQVGLVSAERTRHACSNPRRSGPRMQGYEQRTSATLFPLRRIWSSLVIRLPSDVISLCTGKHKMRTGILPRNRVRADALFGHVLQHHVHIIIKSPQGSNNLLVAAHDDPHP